MRNLHISSRRSSPGVSNCSLESATEG
jgi:hypothetical protein